MSAFVITCMVLCVILAFVVAAKVERRHMAVRNEHLHAARHHARTAKTIALVALGLVLTAAVGCAVAHSQHLWEVFGGIAALAVFVFFFLIVTNWAGVSDRDTVHIEHEMMVRANQEDEEWERAHARA